MKLAILALLGAVSAQEIMPEETQLEEADDIFNEDDTLLAEQPEEEEEDDLLDEVEPEEDDEEEDDLDDEDDLFEDEDEDDLDEDLNLTWSRKAAANIKRGKLAIKKELHKFGYMNPHLRNKAQLKAKLKRIGVALKKDGKNWKKSFAARRLIGQLKRMGKSPQGQKVQKIEKRVGKDVVGALKSAKKINGKRVGVHIDNSPLGQLKVDVEQLKAAKVKLIKAPVSRNIKGNFKAALTNPQAHTLANNLRRNVAHNFKMTYAQERRLELQKKKIGMMIKKLAKYEYKTARVTQLPPSWKK